jgi:hypothetical protein
MPCRATLIERTIAASNSPAMTDAVTAAPMTLTDGHRVGPAIENREAGQTTVGGDAERSGRTTAARKSPLMQDRRWRGAPT